MSHVVDRRSGATKFRPALGLGAVIALALSGCSADVARFDLPTSLSLNDGVQARETLPSRGANLGGSPGTLSEQSPGISSGGGTYYPPRSNRDPGVAVAALPDASAPPEAPPVGPATAAPYVADTKRRAPVSAPAAAAQAPTKGELIEVQQGDTLYGLAKRHKVAISEIMAVNDLRGPNLKPGQKLHLPLGKRAGGTLAQKPITRTIEAAPANPVGASLARPTATTAEAASDWGGSHTVKPGDSLYAIAARHNTKVADLQRVNGITDPRKVRPGTVLKVPGTAEGGAVIAVAPQPARPQPTTVARVEPTAAEAPRAPIAGGVRPTVLNGERTAELASKDTSSDAGLSAGGAVTGGAPASAPAAPAVAPPQARDRTAAAGPAAASAAAGSGKLRWPVRGRVIATFGQRTDGVHNDGVNIAVPMGAEVQAADAGVVAYAGNELKGYGNLVLVRHDNGWVTAYAHNEELLVKRGDKVRRGQTIAKAGKSGSVDQPQVHFELRQGSKPVDPVPFLEKM